MSSFVNATFAPASPVESDDVVFVSGVTALNSILAVSLTEGKDEGLLLGMPVYGSFGVDLGTDSR